MKRRVWQGTLSVSACLAKGRCFETLRHFGGRCKLCRWGHHSSHGRAERGVTRSLSKAPISGIGSSTRKPGTFFLMFLEQVNAARVKVPSLEFTKGESARVILQLVVHVSLVQSHHQCKVFKQ